MNINQAITSQLTTYRKALAWIKGKAVLREHVTLRQFSSANKLKTEEAITLLRKIYIDLFPNHGRMAFGIFLEDGKEPSWLSEILEHRDSTSIWFEWAYRKGPLPEERAIFDTVIDEAYEGTASALILSLYREAEQLIHIGLKEVGIDAVPELPTDFEQRHNNYQLTGGKQSLVPSHINNYCPCGTRYQFQYCMLSQQNFEKFDFNRKIVLETRIYSPPASKRKAKMPTQEVADSYTARAQAFVDYMKRQGYVVCGASKALSSNFECARATLSFVRANDFRSGFVINFPWDNVVFRVAK